MMINQLVRAMLLSIKDTEEYESIPAEDKKRLEEILAFVGGEEVDAFLEKMKSVPDSLYQIKVTLKGSKPPIWRRIIVPSDYSFSELHSVIQVAMGWLDMHLYSFEVGDVLIEESNEEDLFGNLFSAREKMGAEETLISELLLKEGDKCLYTYDFGDDWEHTILLEKILSPDDSFVGPICVKGKRACPPEDCGGIHGYEYLLEVLNGPDSEEKEEFLEWLGDDFDPELFEVDVINYLLMEELY